MAQSAPLDVAIAGGGPVGLTLALALRAKGFSVALADAEQARPSAPGGRAFFIAYGCWRIWRALGLEPQLLPHAEKVLSVEARSIGDGITFLAEECEGEPVLGYMLEQNRLVACLREAAMNAGVQLIAPVRATGVEVAAGQAELKLGDRSLTASLVVGCDGAASPVREAAGLRFEGWDYPMKALSATLALDTPHNGAARQVFLRHGPMALLPLRDNRANLVWTERAAVADALSEMTEADFASELRHAAGHFVGGFKLTGPRHAFAVGVKLAERFHAPRIALAGDSAHLIHPLAGQGLNLGLKDVAALVDVIAEAAHVGLDIGAEPSLAPYTRWRRADVVSNAAAMEAFARAFVGPAPVRAAASLAMNLAGSNRQVRKLFAREAGADLGELPTLMRAS